MSENYKTIEEENLELGYIKHGSELLYIPIEKLVPNKKNDFDTLKGLDDLVESIRRYGIRQPLDVYPLGDGRYKILAGHRRREAILRGLELGYDWYKEGLPCVFNENKEEPGDLSEIDEQILIYEQNLLARDLHGCYLEKIKTLHQLYKEKNAIDRGKGVVTQSAIKHLAEILGIGERQTYKVSAVANCGVPWICDAVEEGGISIDKATRILRLEEAQMNELQEYYINNHFIPDDEIDKYRKPKTVTVPSKTEKEFDIMHPDESIIKSFADSFSTDDYDPEYGGSYNDMGTNWSADETSFDGDPMSAYDENYDYNDRNDSWPVNDRPRTNNNMYTPEDMPEYMKDSRSSSSDMVVSSVRMENEEELMMKSCIWFNSMAEKGEMTQIEKIYVDGIVKSLKDFYFPVLKKKGYIEEDMKDTIVAIAEMLLDIIN